MQPWGAAAGPAADSLRRWRAPPSHPAGTLSPSSDVYAVGVLMWEIFTAEKVFKQLSDSEVILAVVTKKARPSFPSDCPSR